MSRDRAGRHLLSFICDIHPACTLCLFVFSYKNLYKNVDAEINQNKGIY